MCFFLKYLVTLFYKKLRIKIVVSFLRESGPRRVAYIRNIYFMKSGVIFGSGNSQNIAQRGEGGGIYISLTLNITQIELHGWWNYYTTY